MKTALSMIAIAVAAAVAWYLVSPLFVDRTVDEPSPFHAGSPSLSAPTRAEIAKMSPAERVQAQESLVQSMASMAKSKMAEPMTASSGQPVLLARGRFGEVDALHKGSGDALLYRLADGSHLVRMEDFEVANGPDLYVYLAKHPEPATSSHVEQGYLDLGRLKGNIGSQNYPVPAGTAIDEFGSVVIWCKLFGVLFSPAPLIATPES